MSMRVHVKPALFAWACERAGHDVDAYAARLPGLRDWMTGSAAGALFAVHVATAATEGRIGLGADPLRRDEVG
jgi:hypothetical protein